MHAWARARNPTPKASVVWHVCWNVFGNRDRSIIQAILARAGRDTQEPEDIVKIMDEMMTQKKLGFKGILKHLKEGAEGDE